MAITNPCGLSVQQVADIIKNNVLTGNYDSRGKVMQALMTDPKLNLSYSEARQVADYYYSVYRKIAKQNKTKAPVTHLNAEQRTQRQVDSLVLDYLGGDTGAMPLTDADVDHLLELYKLADKADTPSLKAKYDEQANVFIAKFLPTYANELFRSSVYARPLLSAVFFIKSFTSNFHAQVERIISDSIWDGKKSDLRWFGKFDGLANATLAHTLKGGIPATTIAHNEQFDFSKGRLEEFDLSGTPLANANPAKKGYYNLMKFYTKWSNRFNAAPDTRGIYSNAERHFYQLLKEKYRDTGLSNEEATQKALKDIELDDRDTATKMAIDKFTELGLPIRGKNGKFTSEIKVAIQEYMRRHRDHVIWGKALELSKNDFWKKNMTTASELGFGDYGLFGLKAQFFSKLKNILETKTKSKLSSAFQLYALGFLNGAANFAEDAIERFPPYGAVKWLFLNSRKKKITDQELFHDIARRQKDIIVKNFTTAMFFVTVKMLESLICGDKKDKQSSSEISQGFTQIGVCGIPVLVPPQMMVMLKVYRMIDQSVSNDEQFFNTVLNVLPVLVQSNEMGLGGSIDRTVGNATEYAAAKGQGNEVRANEAGAKVTNSIIRSASDMANTFIPLPSRAMNEAGTVAQRLQGETQRQQKLNFAIDAEGRKKGWLNTLGKITVANLGNVTGVQEIMIAAIGSDKPYAMDWQGRRIAQFRGADIVGNGIQYNLNDDLLIDAGLQPPYINRLEKIVVRKNTSTKKGYYANKIKRTELDLRYMTDEEFYNVSKALADFNKDHFEQYYDKLRSEVDSDKEAARREIKSVFDRSKTAALQAVEKGIDDPDKILKFIKSKWKTKREQRVTESTVVEEE